MDKLTLQTLAAHEPRRGIRDTDGDHWHARCLMDWNGTAGALVYALISYNGTKRAEVLEGEPIDCYDCQLGIFR